MKRIRCPGYSGGDRTEFGILGAPDPCVDYGASYEPERYGCVAICDECLDPWMEPLSGMKTYFHCLDRPEHGFARYGVTLIPPESLPQLLSVVLAFPPEGDEGEEELLCGVIREAIHRQAFLIVYGV